MSTVAILPVKTFTQAKRRLRTGLAPGERRALAQAMFCDVLIALKHSAQVDRVLVVSADHCAQRIAGGHGAEVLEDREQGHNVAASHGIEHALAQGAARVVLVAGDCPALDPGELDALLDRGVPQPSVLVIPDRHRTGTNALVLAPPDALAPSFGPDSCQRHVDHARDAGVHAEVVDVPTLALDVDTGHDLAALERRLDDIRGGAANTRGMLAQLARTRAP